MAISTYETIGALFLLLTFVTFYYAHTHQAKQILQSARCSFDRILPYPHRCVLRMGIIICCCVALENCLKLQLKIVNMMNIAENDYALSQLCQLV